MKKINYFILLLVLILPVFVNAGTYDTEVNKANNLLKKDNYVNTYEKYIKYGSNLKFEYSDNTNKVNPSFIKGGFISLDEYNLTTVKGVSYLFDGVEYWTLSKNGDNIYAITYDNMNTAKNKNASYNGRVTEFIIPTVTIHGEGKINNPWTFDPLYKITAVVDSRYATIESGNNQYIKGGCTGSECTAEIVIKEKTGYRYIANDCNGLYDNSTKTLKVNNLSRDTKCKVTFGRGIYIITLNKGTPNKIYLKYAENYYKNYDMKEIIRSISNVSPKTGYTFIGYFHDGHKIINGDKEPNSANNKKILYESVTGKYITSDVTLEPSWEANKYTVSFDCNGGNTPPATQVATYDSSYTITSSVCRSGGYIQTGWNTKADGTGESWTTSNKTNITWKIANNVKLYAVWSGCPAGTYSPESSNTCQACTAGNYCPPRTPSPTTCPDGYTSNASAGAKNQCYINVSAGKYIATANTKTQTECQTGYYKTAHKVNYGSTSSCVQCPANYRDGTRIENKVSESVCLNNVAAGYKVATSKGAETLCDNGYYKGAHSVTYGGTSSCTQCPSGYRNGTSVSNKTSESACLKNVAAGYKVTTSKGAESKCAAGTFKAAHNVTYGNTSTCSTCGVNTYSYEGAGSCTNCLGSMTSPSGSTTKTACKITCGAGTYLAANGTSCSQCPANYYCPGGTYNFNASSNQGIAGCPSGMSSAAGSSTKTSCKITCGVGKYLKANTTSCSQCPANSYCPGGTYNFNASSNQGITGCPSGMSSVAGSSTKTSCKITCGAGKYLKVNTTLCSQCPANYYCSGGTYNFNASNNQGIAGCPSGYISNAGIGAKNQCFINVDAGNYIKTANTSTQTKCGDGYYKAAHSVTYGNTSSCSPCPAGYEGTGEGKSTQANGCKLCIAGKYSDELGSATCKLCAAGTYTASSGHTSCSSCLAGKYNVGTGNTSCSTCLAGTYNIGTGNTSCTTCENGYYCTGGDNHTTCPVGSVGTGTGKTSESSGCLKKIYWALQDNNGDSINETLVISNTKVSGNTSGNFDYNKSFSPYNVPWVNSMDYSTTSNLSRDVTTVKITGEIAPTSTDNWFAGVGYNSNSFNADLSKLNVSNIISMSRMFAYSGYNALTWSIGDLSEWDTSKVTNMSMMFSSAGRNATTWSIGDLSKWNTSKVTDMGAMFSQSGYNATTWSIGDISNWNTSKVTDMRFMFSQSGYNAITWTIGDLSKWDISNITNISGMFAYAGSNAKIWTIGNISNWNTSKVTDMSDMFNSVGESAITWTIGNLSKWNTSKVTNMSGMFRDAGRNATTWSIGDLSNWNTSNVTDMYYMFNNVGRNAKTWSIGDISNWNTSKVTDMSGMFHSAGYSATTFNLDLSNWDTSKVTDMSAMFAFVGRNAKTWSIGDISNWNTSNVTDMIYMFESAGENATTFNLALSKWNTSKVTNMEYMFLNSGNNATTWKITIPKTNGNGINNTTSRMFGANSNVYSSTILSSKLFTLAS